MRHPPEDGTPPTFSRRAFLKGASAAAVTGTVPGALPTAPSGPTSYAPGSHAITLSVNGGERRLEVEPRTTLLDALRDRLDLTGAKKICDRGACGGCTVELDGVAVNSCMVLAIDAVGMKVTTIEGLAPVEALHPLQEEFVHCDALQCGFCTPGFVMAAHACLNKHKNPDRATIQHELSGNLCRCGTYGRVFEAVERAAGRKG